MAQEHPLDIEFEKAFQETRENRINGALSYELLSESMIVDWDNELNRVYRELLNKLSEEKQKQLRNSQRKWIEFRDAEFKLLQDIDENAMYPQQKAREMKYVRQRTLELIKLNKFI
ncbi:MAG: DUF1311 domain-containing protein [Flavobacteriia bacterium]|nr:DUF1311 domain-containing protein [Flavobacteriia bacterium]